MKIALMKIGARIHENDKIGNSTNEVLATVKLLREGGADVVAFTKVLDSDNKNTSFPIKNYEEFFNNINKFDKLVIVNGNINFFGGICSDDSPEIYKAINKFQKEVIYFLYDPYLGFKQCYKAVLSKAWGAAKYTQEDLEVSNNRLYYITQCKDTSKIHENCQKQVKYFPLEKFPLITENNLYKINYDNCIYDLNYAGTFRGGRREESMIKFFFGLPEDIKVQMFGNLQLEQFTKQGNLRAPEFGKPVTHDKVRENIQKGLATVIIGDKKYIQLDDIAQRFYESIIYGQVTFIDTAYDSTNRMYRDKYLQDFLRVSNRDELVERLYKLKDSKELFNEITEAQVKDVCSTFDKKAYCKELVKTLEDFKDE